MDGSGIGKIFSTRLALALLAFFALAVLMTYPLFFRMYDHTVFFPVDHLLNTWILAWDYHALVSSPLELFDANIFYPFRHSLALSEHMVGNLLIFAPIMGLTQNPILAANGVIFASFVLSAVAMFVLVQYWTGSYAASFIAGFIYAFTPLRFGQLGKFQLLSVQWAPFALLFVEKFFRSKRLQDGLLAFSFSVLQVLSSYYLGYAFSFVLVGYITYYLIKDRAARTLEMLMKLTLLTILAAAIIMPFSYPYIQLKREVGLLQHDPASLAWVSGDVALSFLMPPLYGNNLYHELLRRFQSRYFPWERWLFFGFLPILLALIPIWRSRSRKGDWHRALGGQRWDRHTVNTHLFILLICLVMSLGPFLVMNDKATNIPLPYLLFFHLLPGFSAMRAPARFALMAPIGLSVLAGFGIQLLLRVLGEKWAYRPVLQNFSRVGLSSLVLCILIVEFHFTPVPMDPIEIGSHVPPVYRWLTHQPKDGALLEVPWMIEPSRNRDPVWPTRYAYFGKGLELTQTSGHNLVDLLTRARYVYFSVYHWQPLVNGYSGYRPPSYDAIIKKLMEFPEFPDPASIHYLAALGISRIVLHTDMLPSEELPKWQAAKLAETGLEKLADFGSDIVFQIAILKRKEKS